MATASQESTQSTPTVRRALRRFALYRAASLLLLLLLFPVCGTLLLGFPSRATSWLATLWVGACLGVTALALLFRCPPCKALACWRQAHLDLVARSCAACGSSLRLKSHAA